MRMFLSVLFLMFVLLPASSAQPTNVAVANTNYVPVLTLTEEQRTQLTFGLDKHPDLQVTLFGIALWQYVAFLAYVLLAFAVSALLNFIVSGYLKKWAEKTTTKLDDIIIEIIQGPIKIIAFVVFLHIGLAVFKWPAWLEVWISRGLQLVVAGSITYMLLKLVDILIAHLRQRPIARGDRHFNEQLFPVISKTLKVFIVIVAVLVTSQNMGLNITGVLASLSIGGLALGLAAQDTVANLFGAVAVFADKPFRIGDAIKLDQVEGTVETIGLRSTRIRNPDGHLITVPNKTMGNATIINITQRPSIRTVMDIGIPLDTPPAKVRRALDILNQTYKAHPKTKDLIVSFDRFAASALNIRIIHWWNGTDYKAYMADMQELNLRVQEQLGAEKIPVGAAPFMQIPLRSLFLESAGAMPPPPAAPPAERV